MNLYLISQDKNRGYDTYSSAVVAAKNEEHARHIHPRNGKDEKIEWSTRGHWYSDYSDFPEDNDDYNDYGSTFSDRAWAPPDEVVVNFIGEAFPWVQAGVVCASYHAG